MSTKQPMIDTMVKGSSDIIFTPKKAVYPLIKVLEDYRGEDKQVIWECADPGGSKITEVFKEYGYGVVSTDIVTGQDFLTYEPDFSYSMIVTNPPYSIKDDFIKRCFQHGTPFALLMPITALEGVRRGKWWQEFGVSLLVLDRRVDFTGKSKNWFNVGWFIGNFFAENYLFFDSIER